MKDGVTGRRGAQAFWALVVVPQNSGVEQGRRAFACAMHHRGTTMEQYAGIDVSLDSASVCIVDAQGKILKEAKVASEPEALIAWFAAHGTPMARIGLEAGPLSQWLFAEMKAAGLAVELLETRHVRAAFKAMPVKTDRKDARGIASSCGWAGFARCTANRCRPRRSVHF